MAKGAAWAALGLWTGTDEAREGTISPSPVHVRHILAHVPCPAALARPHPSPAVSGAVAAGPVSSGEMRRCERQR